MNNRNAIRAALLAAIAFAFGVATPQRATAQGKQDYLSDAQAEQIRDAQTPADRIKLFLSFADDNLKKFQYEVNRPVPEAQHADILNNLLNAYVGCVDDAADQVDVAQQKQMDVRESVKLMKAKNTEFLAVLEKLDQDGPQLETYRFTLEDAIEGTKEAINDADESQKNAKPAPVRRKQQ